MPTLLLILTFSLLLVLFLPFPSVPFEILLSSRCSSYLLFALDCTTVRHALSSLSPHSSSDLFTVSGAFFRSPSVPSPSFELSTLPPALFRSTIVSHLLFQSLYCSSCHFSPFSPSTRVCSDLLTVRIVFSPCLSVPALLSRSLHYFSLPFSLSPASFPLFLLLLAPFFALPSSPNYFFNLSTVRRAFFVLPPSASRLSDLFTAHRAISLIPSVSSSFSQPLHYPSYLPSAHLI